jgi:hypothetical protein
MAWVFAKGPFGMYRVGQMREQKTFVPIVGFITAADATRAVNSANNTAPYVPPAPLPSPAPVVNPYRSVTVKRVSAKFPMTVVIK